MYISLFGASFCRLESSSTFTSTSSKLPTMKGICKPTFSFPYMFLLACLLLSQGWWFPAWLTVTWSTRVDTKTDDIFPILLLIGMMDMLLLVSWIAYLSTLNGTGHLQDLSMLLLVPLYSKRL